MSYYFSASPAPQAQDAYKKFKNHYGQADSPADADCLISLGGDGQTIKVLQLGIAHQKPVMGINFGHVGHFQNIHKPDSDYKYLDERIKEAEVVELSPLKVTAEFLSGDIVTAFAINEATICNDNSTGQAIYLRISIDDIERIARLGGDGLIVATTAGSTGYNKSAHGPILPLGDDLLALTPSNPFEPAYQQPAVIRPRPIRVDVLTPDLRKAKVLADVNLLGLDTRVVDIELDPTHKYRLLYDKGYSLYEKVMRSQFLKTPSL
ncbi:MAG: NAD(+)/NADH kinase [Alphaproteobacteria bacterium]|nr:NAD(+)/NADH kinase [Alphaproteobacteria bacterium]